MPSGSPVVPYRRGSTHVKRSGRFPVPSPSTHAWMSARRNLAGLPVSHREKGGNMQRKTESEPRTWRPYVLVAVAVVVLLALAGYGGVLLLTPQWVSETGESRPDVVADRFASLVAADDGPSPGIGGAASPRALGPRSGTITLPKLSVGPASGKGARSGVLAALSAGASRSRIDAAFAGATGGARSRSGVDTGGGRGVGMAKGGGCRRGRWRPSSATGRLGGASSAARRPPAPPTPRPVGARRPGTRRGRRPGDLRGSSPSPPRCWAPGASASGSAAGRAPRGPSAPAR